MHSKNQDPQTFQTGDIKILIMASFGVRDKLKFWGAHLGGTWGAFPSPDVIFMVKFGFLMPENT